MFRSCLAAVSLTAMLAAPAFAEGLQASQTVERAITFVDESGIEQTRFETAELIAPGDELRYSLSYSNDSTEEASNVRLVMPVPQAVSLIEGSEIASGAIVTYSADDGETFANREDLIVEIGGEDRAATAEEITHIRWTFADALEAGEAGTIGFHGILQ